MSTLQEVRDRVRLQMDLDEDDLVDDLLDQFVLEGFNRTFAEEAAWPFFETLWTFEVPSGATTIEEPADLANPSGMRNAVTNRNILHVAHRVAIENFQGEILAGEPNLFSMWGGIIYLWPTPTEEDRTYQMRGYRKPSWTGVPTDELDGDARLHPAIAHYACSLAYAQLEDTELEAQYMARWQQVMFDIRNDIMRPQHTHPLILNGASKRSGGIWIR